MPTLPAAAVTGARQHMTKRMGRHGKFRKKLWLLVVRSFTRPLVWWLTRMSWDRADRVSRTLGALGYLISRRYRRVSIANLRAAFPDMSDREAKMLTGQVFRNFTRALIEFFIVRRFDKSDIERVTELNGAEHIDEALRRGKGCIILTAHMGNWEVLARRLVYAGYPLSVIARDSDDPTMTGVVNEARKQGGYRVLSRDSSVMSAMRALKRNELVGILPDQNTMGNCVFVEFFGRPAATAAGAALFAIRTGASIVPVFARWDGETRRYTGFAQSPIEVDLTGDVEKDTYTITAAYTSVIEAEIRRDPAQWLWLHNKWKRTAEAATGLRQQATEATEDGFGTELPKHRA